MALFTDGPVSAMEDLTARDSQLLNVASVEGIDVTQKGALAQDEIALELGTLLTRMSYVDQPFWLPPQPSIANVVVTPALKAWHTLRTLELVYIDAYNNQLNDRYAGKRDQFHNMARWAYDKLIQIGVGVASSPVPQAAAPALAPTPGFLPDGTYFAAMAWFNAQGEEGAASTPAAITTASSAFVVQPGAPPRNAAGWNVYAGVDPGALTLQNSVAIQPGQPWFQAGPLTTTGRAPSTGQSPSYLQAVSRMLQRG